MPRCKLYHTKAELQNANKLKCQRYYQKNRGKILERLLETHIAKKAKAQRKHSKKSVSTAKPPVSESDVDSEAARGSYWLQHARGISARLIKVVTRTPRRFLDDLCREFLISRKESLFTKPGEELKQLRQALHRCQFVILNVFGCRDEFHEVEEIDNTIRLIECWLDDVLMAIMEGRDIEKEQRSGRFAYQKEADLILKAST